MPYDVHTFLAGIEIFIPNNCEIGIFTDNFVLWSSGSDFENAEESAPTSHPLPPTSREDLWLDACLEYPPATKALYIYKHPCLHRDFNPGPTAQQSALLTTIPDG
ncbi:hypothetical protein TNCV_56471 [Trichonephila clavipes]|nr:hypothetical protein TNCV_56471 [Trichonephila clavipes]